MGAVRRVVCRLVRNSVGGSPPTLFWAWGAYLLLLLTCRPGLADSTVVFNELMYHPATSEPTLEWLELHNQNAVDVDLSGWGLTDGVSYEFPEGTVIPGGGYLVVSISPDDLVAQAGPLPVVGPYTGRLSNNGEDVDLRDINGRLMDSVNYGVDGAWPVGPDGAGVSLAKRHPDLASRPAENWSVSVQLGGTPGRPNFSDVVLTGREVNVIGFTSAWSYEDTGVDLGDAWRAADYDDSQWPVGAGLFYDDPSPLPAPKTTPLASGRSTYYFRTRFDFAGDPGSTLLALRPIVDDGAVVYLNGAEVARINMADGEVGYLTPAQGGVGTASLGQSIGVPSDALQAGPNVVSVELHQSTSVSNPGLRVLNAAAYAVAWDGGDGDFSSVESPALAPANDALAAGGVEALTSSNPTLGVAAALNDGVYGDDSAWTPDSGDSNPFIILRFGRAIPVSSIAWSRDNGNASDANCGGTCTDGAIGNYTFQYTLVADPASVLANSSNPSNAWATIATVQHLSEEPGFTPHLRHRYDFSAVSGQPLMATGMRLRVPRGAFVDEIEINPPAVAGVDAVFGMELTTIDIVPPPARLRFNEVSAATASEFSFEIINAGEATVDLSDVVVARSGEGAANHLFGPQSLSPGSFVSVGQPELGFGAVAGEILSLYSSSGFVFLDAAVVRTNAQARFPDGEGEWMVPSSPTPGASNRVALHDEIVLNEIMYHYPPSDPTPAVNLDETVVPIAGAWRYEDTGTDLGTTWREPGFDDGAWPEGTGLLSFNTGELPVSVGTVLSPGPNTYYFRTAFNYGGGGGNLSLSLRSVVDDGAVFYLNGAEIHRQNMPAGEIRFDTSALGPVGNAGYVDALELPVAALVVGANVLAAEVHQVNSGAVSSGLVLSGGGLTLVEEGPFGGAPPPNLALEPGVTPFVIDSLSGFAIHDFTHLNDGVYGNSFSWIGNSGNPGYAGLRFGGEFLIGGFAFGRDNTGQFADRTLGLYTLQYTRVASPGTSTPLTGNPDTGWATIGTLNYQSAGSGLFTAPSRRHRYRFDPVEATGIRLLVPGTGLGGGTCIDELEVNPPDTTGDVAFAAQLALTTTTVPAMPFRESDEEWIELHNRSETLVDLGGWSITGTIDFQIPPGTSLGPGGYLVVAKDQAALLEKWPELAGGLVGDFSGRMSEHDPVVLRDAAGNVADRVRIRETVFSDGGGASLELIDARADNGNVRVWRDSDETAGGQWQTVRYRMVAGQRYGSSVWNEFRIGMLDAAEVLIDDVSVVRNPDGAAEELIQNGGFETVSGNVHWRMLGNHQESRIAVDPADPANHVLWVSASGPARTSHNHIESTYLGNAAILDGQEYEVRFRARWLAGSPQVATSSYFQRLARVNLLQLPPRLGTPGGVNSRKTDNAGPTFSNLRHEPITPGPAEPVTVTVRWDDPDGVSSAALRYRVNPAVPFEEVPMVAGSDREWSGQVPGQLAGRVVQFYVEATDGLGAAATAPEGGSESRALYQVADTQGTDLPAQELRVIQLDADRDFMHRPTNVMSQARMGATVVYNRSEVFYDAGVRLKGSAAGRIRDGDNYVGYDIRFPDDHLFRGVHTTVGIDRSGRAPAARQQHEVFILHMFQRAALPAHHVDLCYFISPKTVHTGTAILQLGGYNARFVDEQFGEDGTVFNFDITYEPSTTVDGTVEGTKLPVPHQGHVSTDFADLGDDKEQYRSPFSLRHGERRDDFSGVMRLCKVMGAPQPVFDAGIAEALDVHEALRLTGLTILCGIGDIYFSSSPSLPHNCRVYTPADGGPAQFLPWDMDFVFTASATSGIFPTSSANIGKFMNHQATRRLYLVHLLDLLETVFNTAYMDPWLAHYGSVVGQNYLGQSSYIQSRHNYAMSQLPAGVPFAIASNGGGDFLTDTPRVTIEGSAWVDVGEIRLMGRDAPLSVTWPTTTTWSADVPLFLGANELVFVGVDLHGNVVATDTLTVTTTADGGAEDGDGDGMPNDWETLHGLDPEVDDGSLDLDGDGLTNREEYLAGTDPGDENSFLRVEAARGDGTVRLSFAAAAGRSYSIEHRDGAASGLWRKWTDVPAAGADTVVALDVPFPGEGRVFRLVTPAQPEVPGN